MSNKDRSLDETQSRVLDEMESRFPWLTVDPESDEWDEPSGADVISELAKFHRFLCARGVSLRSLRPAGSGLQREPLRGRTARP